MTGQDLEAEVTRLVHAAGGLCYHASAGQRRVLHLPGWPDLVIALPDGITLYRELKGDNDRLSDAQTSLLTKLAALGHDVAVWHPLDLATGRIRAELSARASNLATQCPAVVALDTHPHQGTKTAFCNSTGHSDAQCDHSWYNEPERAEEAERLMPDGAKLYQRLRTEDGLMPNAAFRAVEAEAKRQRAASDPRPWSHSPS